MARNLALAVVALAALLIVGTTVAWAAGHGPFTGSMADHHNGQGMTAHMTPAQMQQVMTEVHPGFDKATIAKLAEQCTKAMKDGTMPMDADDMDDMMGGSNPHGGMMGPGSSGMMR